MELKTIIKSKIWISTWIAVIGALLIIPLLIKSPIAPELPKGKLIKLGDSLFVDYIQRINNTNGILILGTSETANTLSSHNYWNILNKDIDFTRKIHQLSGAGRNIHTYFPIMLKNPEAFRDITLMYYVNPIYWSGKLNQFHDEYYHRYVDLTLVSEIKEEAKTLNLYESFMAPSYSWIGLFNASIENRWERYKSIYTNNISGLIYPTDKTIQRNPFDPYFLPLKKGKLEEKYTNDLLTKFKNEIDDKFNVTPNFLTHPKAYPAIDKQSSFQYDMLKSFIHLSKSLNINVCFYLGPYNAIYLREKHPEYLDDYQEVMENIRLIFEDEKVDYIDGSEIGEIPGSFIDYQHTSKLGAYYTALQIKAYYEKK